MLHMEGDKAKLLPVDPNQEGPQQDREEVERTKAVTGSVPVRVSTSMRESK